MGSGGDSAGRVERYSLIEKKPREGRIEMRGDTVMWPQEKRSRRDPKET